MENKEEKYIKLFTYLAPKQKEDIFKIWMKNITNDIEIEIDTIKNEINKYCIDNRCDIMSALYYIYEKINNKYLISYRKGIKNNVIHIQQNNQSIFIYNKNEEENQKKNKIIREYLSKNEIQDFIINIVHYTNNKITDSDFNEIKNMFSVLEKEKYFDSVSAIGCGYYEFLNFNIESIIDNSLRRDISNLERNITDFAKLRRKNPKDYTDNLLNTSIEIDYYDKIPEFEKLMYLPYTSVDKISENESNENKTTNFIEPINSKLSKKQANCLVEGLISLECIDKESKDDMLAFLGINKSKQTINSINWKKSKNLCAYFIDAFNTSILKNERVSWKPFEPLFSLNGLAGAKNDYNKTGKPPKFYKEITELFDKVIKM